MRFGERLKQLRIKHSISGYKLGILTDRPRQFISNIENGHRPPPNAFLLKLAEIEVLNISYDELKAWALEDKYTNSQVKLARNNYEINPLEEFQKVPLVECVTDKTDISGVNNWIYTSQKTPDNAYAVKISDNGMAPKIEYDDIVILEPYLSNQNPINNTICVFKNNKNAFITRIVHLTNNNFILIPANYTKYNSEMYDIKIHAIIGKPIEVIKYNNFSFSDLEIQNLTKNFELDKLYK